MAIRVWNGSALKTPTQIFIKDTGANTIWAANYLVVKETDGSLTTAWDAIYSTTRSTTTTASTTTTSANTTTTYDTDTTASTTKDTATSKSTTTTWNTSQNTTTTYNTTWSTTYTSTQGPYYQLNINCHYYWGEHTNGYTYIASCHQFIVTYNGHPSSIYQGGWTYYRHNWAASFMPTWYHVYWWYRQSSGSLNTTASTSATTSTSWSTSASTTTTYNTTTTYDTTAATATSKTTTTSASTDTSASTTTSLYERLTATGNQTEVASAGAHNARYWDGDSWEED